MKVVVIAGGQGTRIASVNSEIPKAMIPINGKPILEYEIEMALRYGYMDFIFIIWENRLKLILAMVENGE